MAELNEDRISPLDNSPVAFSYRDTSRLTGGKGC